MNDFTQTVQKVRKLTFMDVLLTVFTPKEINDIRITINSMERDISATLEGKKISPQKKDGEVIGFMLNRLLNHFLNETVKEEIKEFSLIYLKLTSNYYEVLRSLQLKDDKLQKSINSLNNFINYQNNVVALTEVVKILVRKVRDASNLNLPAWENSRHYLLSIERKLEGKKKEVKEKKEKVEEKKESEDKK